MLLCKHVEYTSVCIIQFYSLQMPVLCSCCQLLVAVEKLAKGTQIQRKDMFYDLESSLLTGFPRKRILLVPFYSEMPLHLSEQLLIVNMVATAFYIIGHKLNKSFLVINSLLCVNRTDPNQFTSTTD